MEIKVLGPGCAKCDKTEALIRKVIADGGVSADVEKVTDMMAIAGYGVFGTPAVIVDGEVKVSGKVPKEKDVRAWLGL